MDGMSNATKLLLGGAALALLGFFFPFVEGGDGLISISLMEILDAVDILYGVLLGLIAMIVLCFFPSLYRYNSKAFVSYELGAWAINLLFFIFFYSSKLSTEINIAREWDFEINIGIGAILYIAGNIIVPIGLYQIWNSVGGGYVPPVFDAGNDNSPGYRDDRQSQMVYPAPNDSGARYPVARPSQAPVVYAEVPQQRKNYTSAWLAGRDGRSYQLCRGETSIGRSSTNDIQIQDSKVSKHHAKIVERNGHFTIIDLGSTNGTWLNGKLVRDPRLLHTNDSLRFGDSYKTNFITSENR